MREGAVGHVRLVERGGRAFVEKRMTDPVRHATEVLALRALAQSDLPVPELVDTQPGSILMSLMPGERLDGVEPEERLSGMRASVVLLRRLHQREPPRGLPPAPDDALIVQRYRNAGGPPLPLAIPPPARPAFCHGDWTDGNLLAANGTITAVIDWEAAHLGDPLREVSRAAWGAARKDPRAFEAIVGSYGADLAIARQWAAVHAAELWLWFFDVGPREYLEQLTAELERWPEPLD